ncbi:hypothetical protein JCM10212_000366, partial [Sporobolomyces blumeae]
EILQNPGTFATVEENRLEIARLNRVVAHLEAMLSERDAYRPLTPPSDFDLSLQLPFPASIIGATSSASTSASTNPVSTYSSYDPPTWSDPSLYPLTLPTPPPTSSLSSSIASQPTDRPPHRRATSFQPYPPRSSRPPLTSWWSSNSASPSSSSTVPNSVVPWDPHARSSTWSSPSTELAPATYPPPLPLATMTVGTTDPLVRSAPLPSYDPPSSFALSPSTHQLEPIESSAAPVEVECLIDPVLLGEQERGDRVSLRSSSQTQQ